MNQPNSSSRKFSLILLFSIALAVSDEAFSQTYELGEPVYSGQACPAGSVAATISPDGAAISFLFDQFALQGGGGSITSCSIRIPLNVTAGYAAEATFIDYRGFAALPARMSLVLTGYGALNLNRMTFPVSHRLTGPMTDNFSVTQKIPQGNRREKCPQVNEVQLILKANIQGRIGSGQFQLDSGDIGGDGIRMGIALKPCIR